MGDYTDSKGQQGLVFPNGADTTPNASWDRSAPLITGQQVQDKHLWGIPLVSGLINPKTKKPFIMTDEQVESLIDDAVAKVELEAGITVFPTQYTEKPAFDKHEYDSMMYFRTKHRPVMSIEVLNVTPSNEIDIFEIPMDWIETGNLHQGQINVIPMTIAINKQGSPASTSGSGGGAFLAVFGYRHWIPAFWKINYTAGFPSGKVPKVVNEYVGVITAMKVLSMLAATFAQRQGGSLAIDGLSQSFSSPGQKVYADRLKDLAEERAMLTKKLKVWAGTTLFSSNV